MFYEHQVALLDYLSLMSAIFDHRNKAKRRRQEADGAVVTESVVVDAEPGTSGSDSGDKSEGVQVEELSSEEVDDMLTPAQRRFRDKQLKREVCCTIASRHDVVVARCVDLDMTRVRRLRELQMH